MCAFGGNAFVHTMSYLIVQNIPWCHCCVVLHLETHFRHVYSYNIWLYIFLKKPFYPWKHIFSLKMDAIKVFKYHQITFRHHSMKGLSLKIAWRTYMNTKKRTKYFSLKLFKETQNIFLQIIWLFQQFLSSKLKVCC